jgi:orotate phosphoribosyltransferase
MNRVIESGDTAETSIGGILDEETTADENKMQLLNAVAENNAIITDSHIVYKSGRHGSSYINKDALYQDPQVASLMGRLLAERFSEREVEAVVGPALGGIILSQWTAFHLGQITKRKIHSVYAEKTLNDGVDGFKVGRGYDRLIEGKKVLLVEDIVTTGGSVFRLREGVKDLVKEIVGTGIICNRGGVDLNNQGLGEIQTLMNLKFEDCPEEDCLLCKENRPINIEVGHGKSFLAKKK